MVALDRPVATSRNVANRKTELVILGGGLAGGLIALALAERKPELDLLLVEQDDKLGGNHVWSFFGSDVADADRWLLERLVVKGWKGYDVAFPAYQRTLPTTYYSITSERFDHELRATLPPRAILTGARVLSCDATSVRLIDGTTIEADAVIDARGMRLAGELTGGWQKFVGTMVRLKAPHGLQRPIVMDATVDQLDGYRFVYCLPFGTHDLFVEDTYYSDSDRLDRAAVNKRVEDYIFDHGWQVEKQLYEEHGVLPVVSGGDFDAFWRATGTEIAKAGTRAGLFHPLTGYSLPKAVRYATALAARCDFSTAGLLKFSEEQGRAAWHEGSHVRRLTAMLFGAAVPLDRYRVLELFYKHPARMIERFYAGRLTLGDKLRTVTGKPPVPIGRAVAVLAGLGPERTRLRHAILRADPA